MSLHSLQIIIEKVNVKTGVIQFLSTSRLDMSDYDVIINSGSPYSSQIQLIPPCFLNVFN